MIAAWRPNNMSADANSAFGDALSGKRARNLRHDDRGDSPGSLPQNYQSTDNLTAPGQPLDSRRGNIFTTSTTNAQVAPLTTGADWFEQTRLAPSAFEIWFQKVHQQLSTTFADQVTPVRLASHIS